MNYGYFIAKIKNDNMQFLLNRFNEKYSKQNYITIRFFDENPLTVRQIRYNQGGAVCYCMEGKEQGKQKVSNVWKNVNCSEDCKYRVASDNASKPACNLEGTLKFLLPEVSSDRIWIMKITGQTSIKRLKSYIGLQKQLGNSLIGDFTLFLNQEEQTNKQGKTFNNYILDIIKKEDFISKDSNSKNESIPQEQSTNKAQTVDNTTQNSKSSAKITNINETNNNTKTKKQEKVTPPAEQNIPKEKAEPVQTKQESNTSASSINEFENYYILLDTSTITLKKDGKPTEYLVGNFVNVEDKTINVVIPPTLSDELKQCDVGTTVILDLSTKGETTFTNSIEYVQKCIKKVAA